MKKGNNKVKDKDNVKTVELQSSPAKNDDDVWDVDFALKKIKDPKAAIPNFKFAKNKQPIVNVKRGET